MAKKRLGIDALFQTSVPQAVPTVREADATEVEISRLVPRTSQPRTHFNEDAIRDLTKSVREHGVLQPILVRQRKDDTFEIVAGERRWRAAQAAKLDRVPVRVLDLDDAGVLAVAMIENLQREDLNPLEEAEGYIELLRARLEDESAYRQFADESDPRAGVIRLLRALNNRMAGNTKDNVVLSLETVVAEVFGRVGRITWQSFVAHRLPLTALPDDVLAAIRTGNLEYTKARLIARLTAERLGGDGSLARRLRRDLMDQASTEGLSVRGLQSEIARLLGAHTEEKTATPKGRSAARGESGSETAGAQLASLRTRLEALDLDDCEPTRRDEIAAAVSALLRALG